MELFDIVAKRQLDWDYSIVASVLEVYNENVRDLLSVNSTEKMDIKLGPDGVYVPGLTQVSVTTLEEINEVLHRHYMYIILMCTCSILQAFTS